MRKKREEKYTTIKDVAQEADVSIATVSRVINNGNVKPDKKRKVLDAIKKLNYVPNTSARNLASVSETKRISLIIPDITHSYYTELIKGFKDILLTYNYDPIIEIYGFDDKKYEEINQKYQLSSEIKGIVQIGNSLDIANKVVINLEDENIKYQKEDFFEKGTIYSEDKFIKEFIINNLITKTNKYKEGESYNNYLAPTLNDALKLYNKGIVNNPIYTFEETKEISKICKNIKTLKMDFYFLGTAIGRIAIKKIRKENITPINLKLN